MKKKKCLFHKDEEKLTLVIEVWYVGIEAYALCRK